MERETGFEPATPTLARLRSTTELFPLFEEFGFHILEILHVRPNVLFSVQKLLVKFEHVSIRFLTQLRSTLHRRLINTLCEREYITTKELLDVAIKIPRKQVT